MSAFSTALAAVAPPKSAWAGRRWVYVPYDQLTAEVGPLAQLDPRDAGVVLVEDPSKGDRRPYHQAKLALLLANGRQFALEQARRGVAVWHTIAREGEGYAGALARVAGELGAGLVAMQPAERELRVELAPLVARGTLAVVEHGGWLTSWADMAAAHPKRGGAPPWRMDAFYRQVRRRTGVLMEGDAPAGGKFSFDSDNREPWKGEPPAPAPPQWTHDAVSHEVFELVRTRYGDHPGRLDPAMIPSTAAHADALWGWAQRECLPWFGPYEDAMSERSRGLFHTRISALLHLHRLLPARVVRDAAALPIPLASREGFVRQVLGWREFMRHVHEATDGLRQLPGEPGGSAPVASHVGDGGFAAWRGRGWGQRTPDAPGLDGGAAPSRLEAAAALPPALWGQPSGLRCLDATVAAVWDEGYSHHITRLMVLSNLGTLLGWSPRALTDWFWCAYVDAFDWVVEPNVLGMGTFAVGELFTTKPYVSGAAYLHKMGDHCRACAFEPKSTCPITPLYWAFLARNADALAANPRMAVPLVALRKRDPARKVEDARVAQRVAQALAEGRTLAPEATPGVSARARQR